jgi:tripartite-type tricarboxylate transporter receptor subunit TctC
LTRAGFRGARCFMLKGSVLSWDDVDAIAARVGPFGWHLQLQFDGRDTPIHAARIARLPVEVVIDHNGKFLEPVPPSHPAFGALLALLDGGRCWVKLSAPTKHRSRVRLPTTTSARWRARWSRRMPSAASGRATGRIRNIHPSPSNAAMLDLLLDWAPDEATRRRILSTIRHGCTASDCALCAEWRRPASSGRLRDSLDLDNRGARAMRTLVRWLAGALLFSTAVAALAQDYPTRPVRIIVPFAAGGPADIYARFIGQRLELALGQPFVIDDRPGAGSVIGTDAAAKSAPDGYTLLVMSNTQTVNESLMQNKPYALMRDFVPVAPVNYSDLVLVVYPTVPAANVAELIALAKSKPGKLNYASSGPGTPYHMAGELFKAMANVDIVHVPYKGSSQARTDVLGGQVDMMFDAVTTMSEFARSGRVKALATTGKVRSSVLPNVPTLSEAGVVGYEAVIWLGIMAPKTRRRKSCGG